MKYGYYPGCSLHATAREMDESLRAIAGPLGLELAEIADWSCCGATSAHATDHLLAVALSARNLALAEQQGFEQVLAPCAACFSRLATARHELGADAALAQRVGAVLERPLPNGVPVVNLLGLLSPMLDVLRERSQGRLKGLRVACYYGCLLARPPEIAAPDDAEDPRAMEEIVSALGATPVRWNRRLDCCGGSLSLSRTGSVMRLGRAILEDARAAGAQAVAVACPMCQSNLDLRQKAMAQRGAPLDMPVVYLTQLVGLALGLQPQVLGLTRHFVSARPLFERAGAPQPAPESGAQA